MGNVGDRQEEGAAEGSGRRWRAGVGDERGRRRLGIGTQTESSRPAPTPFSRGGAPQLRAPAHTGKGWGGARGATGCDVMLGGANRRAAWGGSVKG